ncbi:MAG TPA: hypothetical protein VL945_00640 [Candidatus Saccharimonadales bacterium]|nr:hypothetical protein [Candidatus Saccharimonadales bacterium]
MPNRVPIQERRSLDFKESIERMRLCVDTFRSNCIGTALYIVGMQGHDSYRNPRLILGEEERRLQRIPSPEIGCLVSWQESLTFASEKGRPIEVYHMGVVLSTDPIKVAHRDGTKGPFYSEVPVWIPDEFYMDHNVERLFYLPRID